MINNLQATASKIYGKPWQYISAIKIGTLVFFCAERLVTIFLILMPFILAHLQHKLMLMFLTSAYDGGKYSKLTNAATYSSLSDYFLETGRFVKIDNVMLGYTKPLSTKYITFISACMPPASNLHTFTKFTGGDPDLIQVNGLYPGVNNQINGTFFIILLLYNYCLVFNLISNA